MYCMYCMYVCVIVYMSVQYVCKAHDALLASTADPVAGLGGGGG